MMLVRARSVWLALAALAAAAAASPALGQESVCDRFAGSPQTLPPPATVEGAQSHVYKSVDGTDLRVHVFTPSEAPAEPRPAVIFFFGGGWMIGGVESFAPQAAYVAARGATAVLADYRTFCRNGVEVDAEVADAVDAVRWVRGHAAELGIDPDRIAVSGGSSGGHLALSTAVFGEPDAAGVSPAPNLLLLFYPCVNLTNEVEQAFSSVAIADHGERLSPFFHVRAGLPPTVILQGTDDPLYEEVKAYCAMARDAGNACELVEYAGAAHGFFNALRNPRSEWYDVGLAAMDDALTREGWLPAKE